MTKHPEVEAPLETARAALRVAIASLLATEDYDDVAWLPDDFSDQIMEIAWKHRADLDGARFRRELKAYVKNLAPSEVES
jgi:hypothetical protein